MKNRAIVVGSRGQDGSLLSNLLVNQGFEVVGISRGDLDLFDPEIVSKFMMLHKPREVYYLAAKHHSSESPMESDGELFSMSIKIHFNAAVNFLEAIVKHSPDTRFFYASSSHVYASENIGSLQSEITPLKPSSPYGITKAAGMMACRHYREKGVFSACGILYNHESPLRAKNFISKKICQGAVRIFKDGGGELILGDLNARVDWGYAPDYVDAMTRILRIEEPHDFIISSGEVHTVEEFAQLAFNAVGLNYRNHISSDQRLLSRASAYRMGDNSFLKRMTGWSPTVNFSSMVRLLVEAELITS